MTRPSLAAVLAALALSACSTMHAPKTPPLTALPPGARIEVFVIRRSWHTDIGFSVPDLPPELAGLPPENPDTRYVAFGFGDRRYLMQAGQGMGVLLGAIWPGDGLVLLTRLNASPEDAFGARNVIRLDLSRPQLQALEQFVRQTLNAGSPPAQLAAGPYPGSSYYPSAVHYSGLHTCNTWTAEALQAAGLPVSSTGVVFSGQVWRQVHTLAMQRSAVSASHPTPPRP